MDFLSPRMVVVANLFAGIGTEVPTPSADFFEGVLPCSTLVIPMKIGIQFLKNNGGFLLFRGMRIRVQNREVVGQAPPFATH
jgi:hypothetical protein